MPITILGKKYSEGDITNGLIAYYPLDGNGDDLSGNNNDGVLNNNGGSASFINDTTKGRQVANVDRSGLFEIGDTQAIDDLALGNEASASIWIRPDQWGQWSYIFDKCCQPSHVILFAAFSFGGPNLQAGFRIAGVNTTVTVNSNMFAETGAWHHVAATYDGTQVSGYYDGQLIAQKSASGNVAQNNKKLAIGGRPGDGRGFDGRFYDVRIYDRALTDSEIQTLYSST